MTFAFQDAVLGLLFVVIGAIASWLVTRAYYERGTHSSLAIVSSRPWRLLATVDARTRARIQVLVDGEPASELTRLRYELANYGHVAIVPKAPLRLPLGQGSVVLEASVPASGPAGLPLQLSVEANASATVLLVDAPVLNSGDRFQLDLIVRNLDDSFEPVFGVLAPGIAHNVVPTMSAPYSEKSSLERLFSWFMGVILPVCFLGWMGVVLVRYIGASPNWQGMPKLPQLPEDAVPAPWGYVFTGAFLIMAGVTLSAGLRVTSKDRRATPHFAAGRSR